MISVEKVGKNVEEAVKAALDELNVAESDVNIDILAEGNKGLLGFLGSKEARVRVTRKINLRGVIFKYLTELFEKMDIAVSIEVAEKEGYFYCNVKGENAGILIGRRGETLDALQYITSLAIQRKAQGKVSIILDVEKYREKREETLISLAHRLSDRAKRTQENVVLEPMNPHERRIIHTALQDDSDVETISEGVDPYRKVMIMPRK